MDWKQGCVAGCFTAAIGLVMLFVAPDSSAGDCGAGDDLLASCAETVSLARFGAGVVLALGIASALAVIGARLLVAFRLVPLLNGWCLILAYMLTGLAATAAGVVIGLAGSWWWLPVVIAGQILFGVVPFGAAFRKWSAKAAAD